MNNPGGIQLASYGTSSPGPTHRNPDIPINTKMILSITGVFRRWRLPNEQAETDNAITAQPNFETGPPSHQTAPAKQNDETSKLEIVSHN